MAYTAIDDPSAHHQTITYSGNGASRSITNTGNSDLKPDWVWIKERNNAVSHRIFDSSRGATKRTFSNNTDAESTQSTSLTAFNTDGFSLGDGGSVNGGSDTYVAWQWAANGGTTTSFSESGSNPGGTYQANTTSGFSIITYTGTGSAGTIPHGLGKRPKWISIKSRTETEGWHVISSLITGNANGGMILNATDAEYTLGTNNTDTSQIDTTNIHVKTSGNVNTDAQNYVAYCFAEIKGYSKFGSYTGNGSQNGTFVYTGFKPAWIMVKRTDAAGKNWYMSDSTRSPINVNKSFFVANSNAAEDTSGDATDSYFDILSNGFKLRQDFSHLNASGAEHIYMAFAEHPFVSSKGVPTTAR